MDACSARTGRTRLVTRLRQRYHPTPAGLLTIILAEFGDFAMMRKMLLGIKSRAETGPADGNGADGNSWAIK